MGIEKQIYHSTEETPRPIVEEDNLGKASEPLSSEQNRTWAGRYRAAIPHLERKRFRIQPDEIWRKRLHAAKEALQECQKQHPEIIALSFYGSATKGYASTESDIDALLFIDGKHVSRDERIFLEQTGMVNLIENLKSDIRKKLDDENKTELSITVRIIDQDNINHILEELLKAMGEKVGSSFDMNNLAPYFGHKCERLGELFTGISVGNKILEYRKNFLEKLLSHGKAGQTLWREIVSYIRKKERPILRAGFEDEAVRGNKYENLYPQTLEQAMKYFVEHKPWRPKNAKSS